VLCDIDGTRHSEAGADLEGFLVPVPMPASGWTHQAPRPKQGAKTQRDTDREESDMPGIHHKLRENLTESKILACFPVYASTFVHRHTDNAPTHTHQ
jgi:hypothetical protein